MKLNIIQHLKVNRTALDMRLQTICTILLLLVSFSIVKAQDPASTLLILQKKVIKTQNSPELVDLLLQLGDFYSHQPATYEVQALHSYQQALLLSNKLHLSDQRNKSLLQLSVQYGILKDLKMCRVSYTKVLKYCYDKKDIEQANGVLNYLQMNFRWHPNNNVGMFNEAVRCLQQERDNYFKLNDSINAALCLKDAADASINMGKYGYAENVLLKVIHELNTHHYPDLRNSYYLLSAIYRIQGNLPKELLYCQKAVKEAQAVKDPNSMGLFYFKLATAYADMGMYESGLFFLRKLVDGDRFYKPHIDYGDYYFICDVLIKQHKPLEALHFIQARILKMKPNTPDDKALVYRSFASCYIALDQPKLADRYFTLFIKPVKYNNELNTDNSQMDLESHIWIAEYYIAEKNYNQADHYLKTASKLPWSPTTILVESKFHLLQFKVDSALGLLASAQKELAIYNRMNKQIHYPYQDDRIEDVAAKYPSTKNGHSN